MTTSSYSDAHATSAFTAERRVNRSAPWNRALFFWLVTVLLFAPLAFGAVTVGAMTILEIAGALLFALWCGSQLRAGVVDFSFTPVLMAAVAFGAVVLTQLVLRTSAYPYQTWVKFRLLAGIFFILFVCVQVMRTRQFASWLTNIVTIFGGLYACFAIVQGLSHTDKIYWLRVPQYGGYIYGSYVNHAHYAGFVELILPIPLALALSNQMRTAWRVIAGLSATLMAVSIPLSGSRGGSVALVAELLFFAFLALRDKPSWRSASVLVTFCVLSIAGLVSFGDAPVFERLKSIEQLTSTSKDLVSYEMRKNIVRDSLPMFLSRPWLGWGEGTFEYEYPPFRTFYISAVVNAAHNDYIQVLVETGVSGSLCMLAFLVLLYARGLRNAANWRGSLRSRLAMGCLAGCTGLLVHAWADFNFQIPANLLWFLVLAMIAAGNPLDGEPSIEFSWPFSRPAAAPNRRTTRPLRGTKFN